MTDSVTVERTDDVAEIVFDAPTDQNLIDEATARAFSACVAAVEDSDARACVVRAAGETFCAGGDLTQTPEAFVRTIDASIDGIIDVYTSDVPYVAALRGAAIGGGLEIAMACDLRVAGEDALLALPEAGLGLIPPAGVIRFVAQVAGRGTALELCLTGERVTGSEALDRGLVTETAPDAEVHAVAADLAAELATNSVPAMAAVKQSVNEAFPLPITDARWDLELGRTLAHGDDFAEGKRAFLERRDPEF